MPRLFHKAPGWVKDGSLFHVRLRVAEGQQTPLTDPSLSSQILAAAANYHSQGLWWCELFLLMPDHAHMLVAFPREPGMPLTVRNWKRATARLVGVKWQTDFFDHRIRTEGEGDKTWHYIRRNPVVKGLCANEDEWRHWWSGAMMTGGISV
jgi:REP element-mobilizing transposase RayT